MRANVRLYYVAGFRALRDYQLKHDIVQRLQRVVTLPLAEIPAQVEGLLRERDELRRELKKVRRRELEREIAAAVAGGDPLVVREFSGLEPADLRFFASARLSNRSARLGLLQGPPATYIVIGRGRGNFDLRAAQRPHLRPAGRQGRRQRRA